MNVADTLRRWPAEPLIVVFFIALEQPLALPDGETFRFLRDEPAPWFRWTDGKNFVGLKLHQAEETAQLSRERDRVAFEIANRLDQDDPTSAESPPSPTPQIPLLITVIEAATVLMPTEEDEIEHAISDAFDRCLHDLRRLMIAYAKVSNDARFRPITRQTTASIVPFTYMTADGTYFGMSMFHANMGTATLPFDPEPLTPEQTNALHVSLMRDTQNDPIGRFAERNRAAWRAYEMDGDYTSATVLAYTSCEVLLNGALLLMAWEEGTTRDDTRGWFEGQQGFMSRILKHMPPRLGGNWSTQRADAPVNRLKKLAGLRHQVVHYAYDPTESETKDALGAASVIEDFLKLRFVERRNAYPRTTLMLLGSPGLLRHGVPQKWRDDFMQKTGTKEPFWLESYRKWLDPASQPQQESSDPEP